MNSIPPVIMGKEASLEGLEFDGETVLCRVCGDKASGFHYGVHACEGCKGFFRRSIQQKIQYRPCLKNQQCNIMRVNRNRCQYCRLKKCIYVGMSRDAVRFGRVPKKEKARIMEQMQRVNSQSHSLAIDSIIDNEQELVDLVISAHKLTNEFTMSRVSLLRANAIAKKSYINCPSHMACPLNVNVSSEHTGEHVGGGWGEFSEYFTPAIRSVVDFAKSIPGFVLLGQDDQVTLLKAGTFEVLLLRFVSLFDPNTNTMLFTNGKLYKRPSSITNGCAGFLLDSMFDFADRFSKLRLSEEELGLFSGIILLAPDRPGLRNVEQVEKIQSKLTQSLQAMVSRHHVEDATLFAKLLMKTTDLRTLNTLHSEKLIEPDADMADTAPQPHHDYGRLHMSQDNLLMCPMDTSEGATAASIPKDHLTPSLDTPSIDINGLPFGNGGGGSAYQKCMLQTPYGTFYREEGGVYGYLGDQPRQRCHTMDTTTRPRLHVIDEGSNNNRRRYTMDREYITKMTSKLNHRPEKRSGISDDSSSPSVPTSNRSSPAMTTPRDDYQTLYRDFLPAKPDSGGASASGCSSRGSPIDRYSPSSPDPRSRSSSFNDKDYSDMRRRCYSFHLNSDGRAARGMTRIQQPHVAPDAERLYDGEKQPKMSADSRRGSVGAVFGLYNQNKSILAERNPAYISQSLDLFKFNKRPSNPDISETIKYQRMEVPQHTLMASSPRHLTPPRLGDTPPATRVSPLIDMLVVPRVTPMASIGRHKYQEVATTLSDSTSTNSDAAITAGLDEARAKREDQKSTLQIVQTVENVVHKKFDKVRKHQLPATITKVEYEKQNVANDEVERMESESYPMVKDQMEDSQSTRDLVDNAEKLVVDEDMTESASSDRHKTASQTHPQLMAYLKQPSPLKSGSAGSNSGLIDAPRSGSGSPDVPGASLPNVSHQTRNEANLVTDLKNMSVSSGKSHGSNNGCRNNGTDKIIKEQVHAVAMLNLKDKLLRKIDSMENLQRIPADKPSQSSNSPEKGAAASMSPHTGMGQTTGRGASQSQAAMYSALYGSHMAALYQPYYGVDYNNIHQLRMLSQQMTYSQQMQALQQFPHLYANIPPVRANGQPLNLSKPLEELSHLVNLSASVPTPAVSHKHGPSTSLPPNTKPATVTNSLSNTNQSPTNHRVMGGERVVSTTERTVDHISPTPNSHIECTISQRQLSPSNHQISPGNHQISPGNHQISPGNHQISPGNHQILHSSQDSSPSSHYRSPSNHQLSPSHQHSSPTVYSHSPS